MEGGVGQSVPGRQLGRMLKAAREEAMLTVVDACKQLRFTRNKLYRRENGEVSPSVAEVIALCTVYGVEDGVRDVMVSLADDTREPGWWHDYGAQIPSWFELFVGLEAIATHIREYQAGLIPGLLQTEAYASVVFRRTPEVGEDDVAGKVRLRMDRQRILSRRQPRPPVLDVILDESVLRRPIPDAAGWGGQLDALIAAAERPGVRLRVVPSARGPYRGVTGGSFVILQFPTGGRNPEPTTVYTEGLAGAMYHDKAATVATFDSAWNALAGLALSAEATRDLISRYKEEIHR